jgi:hypothetical protein
MRWSTAVTAALLVIWAGPAQGARFTLPLPAEDLPRGTLTVKVVGAGMQDIRVGQAVSVVAQGAESKPLKTVTTGKDGRARVDGLYPGRTVMVMVKVGDEVHRSAPLTVPGSGGVRLLLTLGKAVVPQTGGGQLPAGHPPMKGSGGAAPSPRSAATIEETAELADGLLEVVVRRGSKAVPLADTTVQLRGPGTKVASAQTNAAGAASFQLPADSGAVLEINHGGQIYRSNPLKRPTSGGLRATFQVFDRTTKRSALVLAPGTHWVSQIGEKVVRFMQVLRLTTKGDRIFDPGSAGVALPLPEGAGAVEIPAELRGALKLGGPDKVLLMAPVSPAGLTVRVYFTMPYSGDRLTFRQRSLLAVPRSVVAVVNGDAVTLDGPSIAGPPEADPDPRAGGVRYPVAAAKVGESTVFTFVNLPHQDHLPRSMALLVVGLIALWALIAALSGPRRSRALLRRRERLLAALLQARHRSGGKRARKHQQEQQRLHEELRQVWDEPW